MSQLCYAIDGIRLPDYGPCNSGSGPSVCCTAGQICLSNGLCAVDTGSFYNGGCTDPTYNSATCPRFCTTGSNHFIVQCKSGAVKNGEFCCSGDGSTDCCDEASNGLSLAAGSSTARAAFATSISTISSPAPVTVTVTVLNSAIPSFQTTTLTEQRSWSSPLVEVSTVTRTAYSISVLTPDSSPSYSALPATHQITHKKHPKLSRKKRIAIGISLGIGSPLFVISVILLYKYLGGYWDRRRRKRLGHQHDRMAAVLAEIDAAYVAPRERHSQEPTSATGDNRAVELPVVRSRVNSAPNDGRRTDGSAADSAGELATGPPRKETRDSEEPPIRPDHTRDAGVATWLAELPAEDEPRRSDSRGSVRVGNPVADTRVEAASPRRGVGGGGGRWKGKEPVRGGGGKNSQGVMPPAA